MRERTEVARKIFPEGTYTFTVLSCEKFRTVKSTYRKWKFQTTVDGELSQLWVNIFPWESKELLLALGGAEEEDKSITWDDEEVIGKKITATVYHAPDKNDTTKVWPRIKDIKSDEVPF
jgi:hypothetical protein